MLHPQDELIVQRERTIPGMGVLLDNDAATQKFQDSFPHLEVHAAVCNYIRYKLGTSCIASFVLKTNAGEIWAHAAAYRADAAEKIAKACQRLDYSPDTRAIVTKYSLILSLFPFDDDLPSLGMLANKSAQTTFLKKLVPEHGGLHSAEIERLRYNPRRRFVGRIDVNDTPWAVLKLYSSSEFQRARRAAKSFQSISCLTQAKALGHSDRHQAMLMEWVPGLTLAEQIQDCPSSLSTYSTELGLLLSKLHSLSNTKLPEYKLDQQCRALLAIPRDLAALNTEISKQAMYVVTQAVHNLWEIDRPQVSIHGDLNCDQILIGDVVSLIDFDNAMQGHPEQDLGNFLAQLFKLSIYKEWPQTVVRNSFDAIMQEYMNHGGRVEIQAIHLHAAIALLGLIQEPFRRRVTNWPRYAGQILDQAKKQLALFASQRRPTSGADKFRASVTSDVARFLSDHSLVDAHPAVNPIEVQNRVLPLIRNKLRDESLQLRSLRLLRHKPEKRCLIEYLCESHDHNYTVRVIGKAFSKRKYTHSFEVQSELWRNGFGKNLGEQIVVPRPLGVLNEWKMFFQEHIEGDDGWAALMENPARLAQQVIIALEKLQSSRVHSDRQHTITDEIEYLRKCLPLVALEWPNLLQRIESLVIRCQDLAYQIPKVALVPCHRDFYPDQIISTTRGLCLIDFDIFCVSNPGLDLGNFLGHLIERSLREPLFNPKASECQMQLKSQYVSNHRESEWKTIEIFATLTLARHVYISTLFPDRVKYTQAILEECEHRLEIQLLPCNRRTENSLLI